jgi:hypothetical protein
MVFSPTIGAAIKAGYWFLWVCCPACRSISSIDLRGLDRHPDAAVTHLIPALSCRSCRPNALVRRTRAPIADEHRRRNARGASPASARRMIDGPGRREASERPRPCASPWAAFGNAFKDACRAAGLFNRSAHGCRQIAATRAAEAGATVAELNASVTSQKF